jgi:endonuclease-8
MPEGPEVRKYADALDQVLTGHTIKSLTARTQNARRWLSENASRLEGRRVKSVRSHGKHLIGLIAGGYYFHSHLMMWGRWQTFTPEPPTEIDRRERARIVVASGAAILYSAPIFNVGKGDPYSQVEHLGSLGPDVLPYKGSFRQREFQTRLLRDENSKRTIGAALLDQQVLAGLGNYLRAEVLFACRLNPWIKVKDLTRKDLKCLSVNAAALARRSYLHGATATDEDRERMKQNPSLVYQPGREYGTRHWVFRRTNLPCLRCAEPVRQMRQVTHGTGEDERDRIIYFCQKCQGVEEPFRKQPRQRRVRKTPAKRDD